MVEERTNAHHKVAILFYSYLAAHVAHSNPCLTSNNPSLFFKIET